jgi:hypothetical protein
MLEFLQDRSQTADSRDLTGRVQSVHRLGSGFVTTLDDGAQHRSRVVVVATNPSTPRLPEVDPDCWDRCRIGYEPVSLPLAAGQLVIGGGLSAASLAIDLAERGLDPHLVVPGQLTEQRFDTAPGWLSWRSYRGTFLSTEPYSSERAELVAGKRRPGTIPRRELATIASLVAQGAITVTECARVERVVANGAGITLLTAGGPIDGPAATFVCGFERTDHELQLLRCVDAYDEIRLTQDCEIGSCSGAFLAGTWAEPIVGPTARNFHGQREAARRIALGVRELMGARA